MKVTIGAPGRVTTPAANVAKDAARAEKNGFHTIWWPDHLMGWYPQSLWNPSNGALATTQPNGHVFLDIGVAITLAAPVTSEALLGSAVTEIVRRHPAQVASLFLSLHHASSGRAILGIGAGEAENIVPYGIDFSRPVGRLDEALRVIRLLWESDGPVDFDGKFFRLDRAVLGLGPVDVDRRPPFPPIWLASHGPRMLEMCGRHGDGWIPTHLSPADYAAGLDQVRTAAIAAGRDPSTITPAMWSFAVCDDTHELCHKALRSPFVKAAVLTAHPDVFGRHGLEHPLGQFGLTRYVPTHLDAAATTAALDAIPFEVVHDHIPHGTPEEMAGLVATYAAIGLRHFVPWPLSFVDDLARVGPSFKALARLARLCDDL